MRTTLYRDRFRLEDTGAMTDKEGQEVKDAPSIEQYTALKDQLTQQILKKQELDSKLSKLEDSIYEKENEYFNESVYGNIVKGFQNFTKTNTGGLNKRRITYTDDDHIFSLSSVNYIKTIMKRQGVNSNGGRYEDLDDYEDSIDPNNGNAGGNTPNATGTNNQSASANSNSNQSTPGRKRKIRTIDD